jgi:hypothetical protein
VNSLKIRFWTVQPEFWLLLPLWGQIATELLFPNINLHLHVNWEIPQVIGLSLLQIRLGMIAKCTLFFFFSFFLFRFVDYCS